jgi:hypothetical protein
MIFSALVSEAGYDAPLTKRVRGDFRAGVQGAFPFVARSILFLITHGLALVFSGSGLSVIFLSRGSARYAFAGLDTRRYEDLV